MKKEYHRIYIGTLILIVLGTLVWLIFNGYDYYHTSLTERFYHDQHVNLKASGATGHGLGIIGTLLILIGVFGYMARKRYRSLSRIGLLKHWLEFHIFLCTEGALLILFHTTFKFGGIVAISFWSMVAVVASGVIGRFIYIQIPRTIEGRALSLQEAIGIRMDSATLIAENPELPKETMLAINAILEKDKDPASRPSGSLLAGYLDEFRKKSAVKKVLKKIPMADHSKKNLLIRLRKEINLNRKIRRLENMQKLFEYWHVAHLPFALIMLVIAIIHVAVTLAFGYTWIF